MAKDTAAWFGASLQERRRLQTVLWYDDGLAFLPVPEWYPDGVQLFKWVRATENVPSMNMNKVKVLANLSELSGK
jgi:hypothetical protein